MTAEVYVRGDQGTPQRFWDYALRTKQTGNIPRWYDELGFKYSKNNSDLYNSLTDEKKEKVNFLYKNGVKTI